MTAERTALDAARDVAAALEGDLIAAYAVGSVAAGGFEPGRSDLDVVAVLTSVPSREELDHIVRRLRALDVAPARGLELVLYAGEKLVLNLNTGPGMIERVDYGAPEGERFWFVIDRALAERHAVTLAGPSWQELFAPVSQAELLDALAESLHWHAAHEPAGRNTVLNAVRAWRWLETNEWVSKPDAARWLLEHVAQRVEEAR